MDDFPDKTSPPLGYYQTAWDWFCKYDSDSKQIEPEYLTFDFEKTSFRSEPKRLEQTLNAEFIHAMKTQPEPHFITVIPGGRVAGSNGAVISPDNRLIWDISVEPVSRELHSVFSRPCLPPVTNFAGTVAVLTSYASSNYFHWYFDVLARIDLLRQSQIPIDKYVINPVGKTLFQAETLAILGLPEEKLIECHTNTHIEADRLVVPSLLGYMGHTPKWACEFLRNELYSKRRIKPVSGYERIFISRAGAGYRCVLNESAVMNLLSGYGFKSIRLEHLSVYEQAQIFSSAEIVLSPHGAGLTNLIFCKPGTKVVEIFSPNYMNPVYMILSNQMELDYYYGIGAGPRPPAFTHIITDNITVNISELKSLMEEVVKE